MLEYLLCILGGYLLGCSNMALYLSKLTGHDLRKGGSKNLGASNTVMQLGWGWGVLVGAHDIGKAALAVLLAKLFCPQVEYIGVATGVACILGHVFPFYLKFKGGKGFASYLGMILALQWKFALILMAAVVVVAVITDYIVAGTVLSVIAYPVYSLILHRSWIFIAIVCVATVVILVKHRENFVRIYKGTEAGIFRTAKGKDRINQ